MQKSNSFLDDNTAPLSLHSADLPGKIASAWIDVCGMSMHTRVALAKSRPLHEPVVLVHGLGVSSRYMEPLMRCLASSYSVYAPDLPGFGKSEKPDRALNVTELADALVGWMDAVGLGRVSFVANSFGCQVVIELAVRHPHRISKVVLQGLTAETDSAGLLMLRLLIDATREPLSLLPIAISDYFSAGVFRMLRTLNYLVKDCIEQKLSQISHPALVVRGSLDPIMSRAWAEKVVALLPNGRLAEAPEAPHAVNYAAPGLLADMVQAFLEVEGSG